MTLQEILKEYGFSKMPKGTTEQQWLDYHEEMVSYEKTQRPRLERGDITGMDYHCFMPNRPGYIIANND